MPANEHESTQVEKLLYSENHRVWGDASFKGIEKSKENKRCRVNWLITEQPGRVAALPTYGPPVQIEKIKANEHARES